MENNNINKSNMKMILVPWILVMNLIGLMGKNGAVISIISVFLVSLIWSKKYKFLTIEKISFVPIVVGCGLIIGNVIGARIGVFAMQMLFGLLWLSSIAKIPLTAYYSCEKAGGEKAFQNKFFLKINGIITSWWGIEIILTGLLSYFAFNTPLAHYTTYINIGMMVLLGMYTNSYVKNVMSKVKANNIN